MEAKHRLAKPVRALLRDNEPVELREDAQTVDPVDHAAQRCAQDESPHEADQRALPIRAVAGEEDADEEDCEAAELPLAARDERKSEQCDPRKQAEDQAEDQRVEAQRRAHQFARRRGVAVGSFVEGRNALHRQSIEYVARLACTRMTARTSEWAKFHTTASTQPSTPPTRAA